MSENPYASPTVGGFAAAPVSDAEATRKQYLSHEASVQSIGLLYMLGAIIMVLAGVGVCVVGIGGLASDDASAGGAVFVVLLGIFYAALGILQGATAIGLRKLQSWARYVSVVFSVIGLIGIPIGTLISAYFLYLLLSKKGTVVFSPEYKQVIAATPHIRYKTSIVVIVLLVILLVLFVGGILALVLGGG